MASLRALCQVVSRLMVADKAAEILSSVCAMARERKQLVLQPGIAAQAPSENAVVSSISTLRATVTGECHANPTLVYMVPVPGRVLMSRCSSTPCRPHPEDEAQGGLIRTMRA
jgi:hypothetical protein